MGALSEKIDRMTVKAQLLWSVMQRLTGTDGKEEKPAVQSVTGTINQRIPTIEPDANLRFAQTQYAELFKSFSDGQISAKKFAEDVKKLYVETGYLAGVNKTAAKAAKEHADDIKRLTEAVTRRIDEEKEHLALGRELTNGEKILSNIRADMASKAITLSAGEYKVQEAWAKQLDTLEKLTAAADKLKKVKSELADIVTKSLADDAEHIARMKMEGDLIGRSAAQQQLIRSNFEAELALKKQIADIDLKTKGMTDPAEVARLKAQSDARIEAIKAETRARINAKYLADVDLTTKAHKNPDLIAASGATQIQAVASARQQAADAEHNQALMKIADFDAIFARDKAQREFDRDMSIEDTRYADKKIQLAAEIADAQIKSAKEIQRYRDTQSDGRTTDSDEAEREKIQAIGTYYNNYIASLDEIKAKNDEVHKAVVMNVANELANEQEKNKVSIEGREAYRAEVEKYGEKSREIAEYEQNADEAKRLGTEFQMKLLREQLDVLATRSALEIDSVGTGEERLAIQAEMLKLEKELAALDVGKDAKEALRAASAARKLEEARSIAENANKALWSNMITSMENDFHNGMLRLLEQGKTTWGAMIKGFANTFKVGVVDYMYKQLAKPIIFKFVAQMAGLLGANGLAVAAGKEANSSALLGDNVTGTSWLSIASSAYKVFSGGLASAGTAFANTVAPLVSQLGGFLADHGVSTVGKYLMQAAADGPMGSLATAGSAFAGAAAGITIGTFIAGDKTILGLNGMTASTLGAAAGAYIGTFIFPVLGTAVGAFIGGVAGGLLTRIFGRGPKVYGPTAVKGDYSASGFSGVMDTPWTQKGGIFRSGKSGSDTTPLSEDQDRMLDSAMLPAVMSFSRLIAITGEATRSLDNWSFAINRQITTDEEFKKLQDDISNDMGTKLIPELEQFREEGESLADTAVKMADTYAVTEMIFRTLGFTTAQTGIASLGMRDSLVKLMGGLAGANATMESYYKNFYSADEQHMNSLRQVNDSFAVLGLTAPKTRAEFRALAETLIKDTTPAGQALFVAVMQLNPAFASVTESVEELEAASLSAMGSIAASLDKLRGNSNGSLLQAQLAQDTAMTALTAAAPWITSFEQLSTITMEDANNYSVANKKLIANALSAGATLDELKNSIKAAGISAMNSIGSALNKLRGTNGGSLYQAQLANDTAMVALTAAAPWIKTMDQLQTITMEDAGNYSTANKILIANALGAAAALKDLKESNAKNAVMSAFARVQRSVQVERDTVTKAYQSSLDKVNKSVATVNASVDKLKSLSGALRQSVADIRTPTRAQAQAQILTALTIARASGKLPTAESLADALRVIGEPSERLFSTFVDFQIDQKLTANNIEALADMTDIQLSVEDKQLGVLEATRQVLEGTQEQTMLRLDGILTRGQLQLDEMNGIDASIVSVVDAVNMMSDALNNFIRVRNNEPGFVGNESQGAGTGPGGSYTFEDQARDRGYGTNGSTKPTGISTPVTGGTRSPASFVRAWSILNNAPVNTKAEPTEYEKYLRLITANKPAQYKIPPGYVSGGTFSGGARIVGEGGPELEFTGPSRIASNSASKRLLDSEAIVKAIEKAAAADKKLQEQVAIKLEKMQRDLEKMTDDGVRVYTNDDEPLVVV